MSDDQSGSPLNIPPGDLHALAALLEALVPGRVVDAPSGWSDGWHACCVAIRAVATAPRPERP